MLFQSTVHRSVGGKQIVGSGEWKKEKDKLRCAHKNG